MFLTNKRLFFLDADLERIPMLEAEENSGGLVLSKLKVTENRAVLPPCRHSPSFDISTHPYQWREHDSTFMTADA